MRYPSWLVLLAFFCSSGTILAQCSSQVRVENIDKQKVREIQSVVNDGHQPWRLDAQAVAASKALELDNTPKERWNVYRVPATSVSESETGATYEFKSQQPGVSYLVTVKRFDWLLPSAKKWKWMIWTPTEVQFTRCR
jgi:hypothetical protein